MNSRSIQILRHIGSCLLLCVLLRYTFTIAMQPDWRDTLRQSDALLAEGKYRASSDLYNALIVPPNQRARVLARQGMAAALRGDTLGSQRLLARSLGAGLEGRDVEIVRLYQARVALAQQRPEEATQFWQHIPPTSPLRPFAAALWGYERTRAGDLTSGVPLLREAMEQPLPSTWQEHLRPLLLVAAHLAPSDRAPVARVSPLPYTPELEPLLPMSPFTIQQAQSAIDTADPLALGQLLLEADMPGLAARAFAHTDSPTAQAWVAYARWRAGESGSLADLGRLAASSPDSATAQALLVITALADDDRTTAQQALERARELAPEAAETRLAEAQWFASAAEYPAALRALQQALAASTPMQRAAIARTLAELSVQTGVEVCSQGQQAAALAARLEPQHAPSLELYAATLVLCGDAAGALAATDAALALNPASPAAHYYRGRALLVQGDKNAARQAFTNLADLATDDIWRERAATQLALLP